MISGDLQTMSLADLLQWADVSGAEGRLTITRGRSSTWLVVGGRIVRTVCPPPEPTALLQRFRPDAADEPWLKVPPEVDANERLIDLFLEAGGAFRFERDIEGAPGVEVELPLRQVVYEGMRHLDEWTKVASIYGNESARLRVGKAADPVGLSPLAQVLLRCASRKLTLGEVRVSLGLSRPATLRRVHELVKLEFVDVEGTESGSDPVGRLVAQAMLLADAEQYDEARHVLESVLATDPADHRVRDILEDLESRQLDSLRELLHAATVVRKVSVSGPAGMTPLDREFFDRLSEEQTVGAVVLTSPLRELETLRTLRKLAHLGLVGLEE